MNGISKKLIEAVKNDLTPSLGVTEPGAIAYAAAGAARALGGRVKSVRARLNSCIYKNSFTCAVPGTDGMGCALAAALGAVAGDPDKKLMSTELASNEDIAEAKRLVSEGLATAEMAEISPEIYIEATVETENGEACAVVSKRHDLITSLYVNGKPVKTETRSLGSNDGGFKVSCVSFDDILDCVESADDLGFIMDAVRMDLSLFEEGREKGLMPLTEARCLFDGSASARKDAELYTCGAIEARVRGAARPAMAITGSGSHGILCTLPVYEAGRFYADREFGEDDDHTQRAILLSMLVTKYIKELSGLLSTACGCVLAGGTGAALGLTYLYAKKGIGTEAPVTDRAELKRMLSDALNSMAASVTGMICHGGNTGCSLKASVGVNMAFAAAEMAVSGRGAESVHGILGLTPEETMRNMGKVARDMLPVEKTIIDIMDCKGCEKLI